MILVPALSLLDRHDRLDRAASTAYAQRASETWFDGFLLAGSLGLGSRLPLSVRRELVEIWLESLPPTRLMACAWERSEVDVIAELGVRPVLVLRRLEDNTALMNELYGLPANVYLYSHPQYSRVVLSPTVLAQARAAGVLPAGAKVSKIELDEVKAFRHAAGRRFELFDGRCRHLRGSVAAGASGVVAVPLSTLPHDLPSRDDLDGLQAVIDQGQRVVDAYPDVASQAAALRAILEL